jgi:hypothetical protein
MDTWEDPVAVPEKKCEAETERSVREEGGTAAESAAAAMASALGAETNAGSREALTGI